MEESFTWSRISTALQKVLSSKTSPELVKAILEDLEDELMEGLKG